MSVRNHLNLSTGLVAVLPNGLQPFVNFRAMVGNSQFNNYAGTFGLRVAMQDRDNLQDDAQDKITASIGLDHPPDFYNPVSSHRV